MPVGLKFSRLIVTERVSLLCAGCGGAVPSAQFGARKASVDVKFADAVEFIGITRVEIIDIASAAAAASAAVRAEQHSNPSYDCNHLSK